MDRLKKKRAKDPDENQVKEICEEIVETFEKALKVRVQGGMNESME